MNALRNRHAPERTPRSSGTTHRKVCVDGRACVRGCVGAATLERQRLHANGSPLEMGGPAHNPLRGREK